MDVAEVSDAEITALTQSILMRYGIDFTCYEPKSLKRRVIRVISILNLHSIHELWVKFLHDTKFVNTFMNEISVGMTSMFRDPVLWRSLKKIATEHCLHAPLLSIWHAGCSTGEEVYSMGILLREMNLQWKAKAHCTDINMIAMDEAKSGNYHKIKMLENERNYKDYNATGDFRKFYEPDGQHIKMDSTLIRHTHFEYHNLITDPFPEGFDIIFCRNVMIYFDNNAKVKLVNKFYQALRPGGYFIIGFFDAMGHLMDTEKFKLVDEDAKIFQKR